jgi:hypothetical protein
MTNLCCESFMLVGIAFDIQVTFVDFLPVIKNNIPKTHTVQKTSLKILCIVLFNPFLQKFLH